MSDQSKDSQIHSKRTVQFLLRESFKEKRLIAAILTAPISALAIGTAIPYIISTVLAKLAQGEIEGFAKTGVVLLVITVVIAVISNRFSFLTLLKSQAYTLERLQNEIFANLLQKDRSYFANRMTGKLISDVLSLQSAMMQFQDILAINALPLTLNLVFGIVLVSTQSWWLGLGLFIMTASVLAAAVYYSRKRAPLRLRRHEIRRELHGYFADSITNNSAVKIFANEEIEEKSHNKLSTTFTNARLHDWSMVAKDGSNRIAGILVLQILFVVLVIQSVQANPALLATGIFAFSFTITLTNRLFELSSIVKGLESSITDAAAAFAILQNKPTIIDAPHAKKLKVKNSSIDIRNINFRYGDGSDKELLFKNLNLSIEPGEKIGLVGRSGGGKTTITNLLLRFNELEGGEIVIDGQNIKNVTQESLRRNIAYVPQEPLLFHRTLSENISYGKPSASQKDIEKVADLAHAHEFIKDLPEGYDTLVGERGVKLSGGQRQRVAIARAMIKDAPILLLDEATSALDSESEVLIQDALWKLMEGRTAIVIAHRLSTIQKMDRIIVMDNGAIAEQGTHKELIAKKGIYADLWNHQTGGFIEE